MSATMPRETPALADVDLKALAAGVQVPVLLILGTDSPAWAKDITCGVLPRSTLAVLDGQGHDAVDAVPAVLAGRLDAFFS